MEKSLQSELTSGLRDHAQVPFKGEAIGVIPARCASTRFPDKPLALLRGIPMVCWTLYHAEKVSGLKEVMVAAEDEAIVEAVQKHGGKARLIQGVYRTGSDRVAAAVAGRDAPAIVNIQADEPLLDPATIDRALHLLEDHPEFDVTTVYFRLQEWKDYQDPNCVKVVVNQRQQCLYFSRSPIPAIRKASNARILPEGIRFFCHLGIYCFRPEALRRFTQLPSSSLEECEGLEQLRLLENGMVIGAVESTRTLPGVNTLEDLHIAEHYLKEHGIEFA
ncbi:MAG: 3-deoxy-manno-octulosonate cytidylyltransferase [bacterium]